MRGMGHFLQNVYSEQCNSVEVALMEQLNIHGYGEATPELRRLLQLVGWRTAEEVTEGDGSTRPCFLNEIRASDEHEHTTYSVLANEGTNMAVKVRNDAQFGRRHEITFEGTANPWASNQHKVRCSRFIRSLILSLPDGFTSLLVRKGGVLSLG